MTNTPRFLSRAELEQLDARWRVSPSTYTKPFRLYCDVDGVIKPSLREDEDFDQFLPLAVDIDVLPQPEWLDSNEVQKGEFYWNSDVIERLATLSRSPHIDFVWLTDRRLSAPYALDELLGIESIGYLHWESNFPDWSQAFKRVAVQEDQKAAPCKFIWLDDRGNFPYGDAPHIFAVENDDFAIQFDDNLTLIEETANPYRDIIPIAQYLSITTEPRTGLTMEHLDTVEAWVKENLDK